jgi:hypothetical protein
MSKTQTTEQNTRVCPFGVAVLKKRGASVEQGYVVMDLDTFARILHELRGGTNL